MRLTRESFVTSWAMSCGTSCSSATRWAIPWRRSWPVTWRSFIGAIHMDSRPNGAFTDKRCYKKPPDMSRVIERGVPYDPGGQYLRLEEAFKRGAHSLRAARPHHA